MTLMKRPLATAGATVLLALSLTACGGGAPTDASTKDFCDAISGSASDSEFTKAYTDKDWGKIADLVHDQADELEKVGTPKDISDDAREGFEIQVDAAKDIDEKDIEKAFKDAGTGENPFETDLSSDEKKKVEAFTKYQGEKCSGATDDESSDLPSDLPTDVPTDLPSDLPTDLPSDLPTSPEDLESLLSDLPTDLESLLSDLPTPSQ
ncbi:hypothetical protein [Nocardioides nitrophenolicus]|uniref:hypothetical protein n=1 Tax=Nocardioides nitrophenolicus TaxID=60489 RepID=UPI00195AB2A0|nr:hypothetical protein [Nocardioides nitrophenolicus]MBM7517868.1 hypothetical protein [Nocardioides nitrophenolicus]